MTAPPAELPAGNASRPASVEAFTEELRLAIEHSERAGAELEALIKSGEGSLDPDLADSLQRNLAVVNQAIAESRTALTNEPSSLTARASLFEALSRKISVLQSTVVLMNEMRQGNAAEPAAVLPQELTSIHPFSFSGPVQVPSRRWNLMYQRRRFIARCRPLPAVPRSSRSDPDR